MAREISRLAWNHEKEYHRGTTVQRHARRPVPGEQFGSSVAVSYLIPLTRCERPDGPRGSLKIAPGNLIPSPTIGYTFDTIRLQTMTMDQDQAKPPADPCFWSCDFEELRRATGALEGLRNAVEAVRRRPPGRHNGLTRLLNKWPARLLALYTPSLLEFNASVSRSLEEIVRALEHLSMNMLALDHLSLNMAALEGRLAQAEKRSATFAASI